MVRAFDRRQVLALKDIDLAGVVREVYESAICMGVQAMETLGVPPKEVEEVEQQRLRRLAAQGSLMVLLLLMLGQVTHLLLLSPLIIHLRTIEQKSSLGTVQQGRFKSSTGQERLPLLKSLLD